MADIFVDTYKLKWYAQRISDVNNRIKRLDRRLDDLYMRVGLQGLWDLMQADALTCYSMRLIRCQTYLQQTAEDFDSVEKKLANEDPLSFDKTVFSEIQKVVFDVGVAVKKSANSVKRFVKKTIADISESYYSYGTVYEIVQYGKATLTAVKGVAKIASGVTSIIGSAGMSTPVAILAITSGINDVCNSIMDGAYTATEQYDKIGQNLLKDKLVEGGKAIGAAIGNEELGELFGNATYYGIDIVTSLESLHFSMDKIKQLSSTDMGKLVGEIKEIGKLDVSKIFTTDIRTLRYQAKLASYTFKETSNFVSNVGALLSVGENAVDVGKMINDIYVSNNEDFENPVLKEIDKISAVKNLAKGSFDLATWDLGELKASAKQVDSLFVFKKNKTFINSSLFLSKEFSVFKRNVDELNGTLKSVVTGAIEIYK